MAELATPAGQADPYPIYKGLRALGNAVTAPDGTVIETGYSACSSVLRDNRAGHAAEDRHRDHSLASRPGVTGYACRRSGV